MSHVPTYRYLNLERRWPGLRREGIEIGGDGALRLARLPHLAPLGEPLAPVPGLEGPVGIGADECGNLYIADPALHRILRLDACGERPEPLPCLRSPGTAPGELHSPRGVAVGRRGELYIADSRNARIVVIDVATLQLRGIWDGSGGGGAPFEEPWDVAVDSCGRVYVADPGAPAAGGQRSGGSLRRFGAGGRADNAFAATLAAQDVRPLAPAGVALAVLDGGEEERLLVVDTQPPRLLVYRTDGTYDADATGRWARALGQDAAPGAAVVAAGVLYVAQPGGRVLAFDADGAFLGLVPGVPAAAAGLGVDCHGRLVVHPGGGAALRRALELPAYASCGTLLAGPYRAASDPTRWQRLRLSCDPLPDGAHFRLYTLTSNVLDGAPGNVPAPPADCAATAPGVVPHTDVDAAPLDTWRAAPLDAADLLALNAPGEYLWIAAVLAGDGAATPVLRQIELHHDEDGWLAYLPALYRRASAEQPFLQRALALFETGLDDLEAHIEALPLLFDAFGAPDRADAPWLEWLAGWVDVQLVERWPDAVRRNVVAQAFRMHARRGTRESLRRLVELYAGVTPFIEEAQPDSAAWSLGETSLLGFETTLAPAPAAGAVLGTTAVADHSHVAPEEPGAPLFDDTAHLFFVSVYGAGEAGELAAERVRRVLDREKPAHTVYHLCVIGPRMRVGVQARLGIDAIVGAAAGPPARLGGSAELGRHTVLAGANGRAEAVRGRTPRVDLTTVPA